LFLCDRRAAIRSSDDIGSATCSLVVMTTAFSRLTLSWRSRGRGFRRVAKPSPAPGTGDEGARRIWCTDIVSAPATVPGLGLRIPRRRCHRVRFCRSQSDQSVHSFGRQNVVENHRRAADHAGLVAVGGGQDL